MSARKRLAARALKTPLRKSSWLSEMSGADVFLKLENLQLTGSFKFRGALNSLLWAKDNGIGSIFTASAGNHGLGVAEATRYVDCEVTVCLPANVSPMKLDRLRRYNVKLIQHGEDCEVTESYAKRLAKEKKAFYLSPYNHPEVIAGQGTVGLEMLEELPELNKLIVAVGGGGLIGGMAVALRAINPAVHITGVVAANSPVMKECVRAGRVIPVMTDETIADGIAGNIDPDSMTFPLCRELIDQWVAVEEKDIRDTVFEFLFREGMVIEGSAAAAVAAISRKLVGVTATDKVGIVVCGGNIPSPTWMEICLPHLERLKG